MNERSFTGGRIMKDNPAVDKREQILVAAEHLPLPKISPESVFDSFKVVLLVIK